jgi:hypothetical protein
LIVLKNFFAATTIVAIMLERLSLLLFVPPVYILIRATIAGWKLVDEVNAAVPWQERFRHYGRDPVRAWEKHESLFPDRLEVRRRVKKLYLWAIGLFAAAFILGVWVMPSR